MSAPAQKTANQIADELRQPIAGHKWRLQSAKYGRCTFVAYVDARLVADRLNAVLGLDGWKDSYYDVAGNVYCALSIRINGEWITRSDCGVESRESAKKGQASDAFKRAAVKFSVARFLYDYPIVSFKNIGDDKKPIPCDSNGSAISRQQIQQACEAQAKWIINNNKQSRSDQK